MQRFANAVAKGEAWVAQHTAEEVAAAVAEYFADTDEELLAKAIQSYQDVGAYCTTPVMKQESFELLQTVMNEAGELDDKAPFDAVVDNSYAEQAAKAAG